MLILKLKTVLLKLYLHIRQQGKETVGRLTFPAEGRASYLGHWPEKGKWNAMRMKREEGRVLLAMEEKT